MKREKEGRKKGRNTRKKSREEEQREKEGGKKGRDMKE